MPEEHNQQDELWVDVPEPEEIDEEEAHALPLAVDPEGERDALPGTAVAGKQPKRPPDMYIDLRGAPFGSRFPHDHNLRVPVFFEENEIRTIGHSTFWRAQVGGERRVRWFVRINSQRLRDLGATPRGIEFLIEHEAQGHCRGFGHGEANSEGNPAFHPAVNVKAK
jgi:hypothetical protein